MKKVTGIGGIFFKCNDPEKMRNWYAQNLGLKADKYGTIFEFRNMDRPEEVNQLVWNPFAAETKYFEPSTNEFMINYRVENLEALAVELKQSGVTICDEIQTFEYGKFLHIMDPEGHKIELWEPVNDVL